MKKWIHTIEKKVDGLIPYCLVLLIIVLVLELGFHNFVVSYGLLLPIDIIDYFIILVFVLDLIFKFIRVKSIPLFFKKYWLEIIAVFPFFLFFRLAEFTFGVTEVSEGVKTAQSITHSTTQLEKEVAILNKGESVLKLERSSLLSKYLEPLSKFPRFLRTIPQMLHFFNKPTGEHHPHDFNNK